MEERRPVAPLLRLPVFLCRLAIHAYQVLRTGSPRRCRFAPSCSDYWLEALEKHGLFRGLFYGIRRLGRCHPWHPGGHDPVPM